MKLYQKEKYQVLTGSGKNIAVCTVWNEANQFFNYQDIQNKVALVGTLYSRQGVNIILRNLALNPQINKLYVWGYGKLSQTEFGEMGKKGLLALWQGEDISLPPEFDLKIIKKIINNVELIDVSHLSISELYEELKKEKPTTKTYMKPVSFPEPKKLNDVFFPSEEVGFLVRGESILETWLRVVDRIMRYGIIKGTQYGYQQRELIGFNWVSNENPDQFDLSLANDWPHLLKKQTGVIEKDIFEYCDVFLSKEKQPGISYTYGNRLMDYPLHDQSFDQIEEIIIKQIQNSPDSRRAVATTLIPKIDAFSSEPPCITQVQALQSNGKLHFLVTARSHDIFKAALPNAYGLRILQKKITDKLGFELGYLQISSQSAHIYEQDFEEALKLVKCHYWERKAPEFDEEKDKDKRGYFVISVNQQIEIVFNDHQGRELFSEQGRTANEIINRLAHLQLINKLDHALYLGKELQKAEIALKKGWIYQQDQELIEN